MSAGFTPGPWTPLGKGWAVHAADGQMKVCDVRGWGYLTGKGSLALPEEQAVAIQTANEALIAAAPDLYDVVDWIDKSGHGLSQPIRWAIRDALAKARGEVSPSAPSSGKRGGVSSPNQQEKAQ